MSAVSEWIETREVGGIRWRLADCPTGGERPRGEGPGPSTYHVLEDLEAGPPAPGDSAESIVRHSSHQSFQKYCQVFCLIFI